MDETRVIPATDLYDPSRETPPLQHPEIRPTPQSAICDNGLQGAATQNHGAWRAMAPILPLYPRTNPTPSIRPSPHETTLPPEPPSTTDANPRGLHEQEKGRGVSRALSSFDAGGIRKPIPPIPPPPPGIAGMAG